MNRLALSLLVAMMSAVGCLATVPPAKTAPRQAPKLIDRNKAPKEGATATLKYERLADMATARTSHTMFPTGNGFVVVGGTTTNGNLASSAELYENGKWKTIQTKSPHADGFVTPLGDGRYMVGGSVVKDGNSSVAKKTEVWNPSAQQFTAGPDMTVGRSDCNAILANGRVYVSGNNDADDKVMDCYDGSTFKGVGSMDGRYRPYLFYSSKGYVISMSYLGTDQWPMELYTFSDGSQGLLADRYNISTGETNYVATPYGEEILPTTLPAGMAASDYHFTNNGQNLYMVLAGMLDDSDLGYHYVLLYFCAEENQTYIFSGFQIPMHHPVTGEEIEYRGGVIVNQKKQEAYLIGFSGTYEKETLHIISFNYSTEDWTIASASGFTHDMTETAAWTLLADGRLACTGGSIMSSNPSKDAYIFTPPVAGQGDGAPEDDDNYNMLMVYTKDGTATSFVLMDKPQVRFEGKNLHIVSKKADVTYAIADVLRFTYVKGTHIGIEDQADEHSAISYQENDGTLVLSQMKVNASVGVYTLDGKLVKELTTQRAGTFRLNLSTLPQGVYIVKADNLTYKLLKR